MAEKKNKEQSFEEALARLEALVRTLETGEKGLDESLALFEEGVSLVRFCTERLDSAEQKVKILMKNEEGYTEEPFDAR